MRRFAELLLAVALVVFLGSVPPVQANNIFPSMTTFAGVPSGSCTDGTFAMDQANSVLYVCNGGVWVTVGGLGGTISSPFVPYASGADTLADSSFYYATTTGCFAYPASQNCLQSSIDPTTSDTVEIGPGEISVGTTYAGMGGVGCVFSESGSTACNGTGGALILNAVAGTWTLFDTTMFSPEFTVNAAGAETLGTNGDSGGSLQLFDATSGSSTLSVSGGTLVITGGSAEIPAIESVTGQRFVCVDNAGNLVSSVTACVGT